MHVVSLYVSLTIACSAVLAFLLSPLGRGGKCIGWNNNHIGSWYHGKNPKNHLNYFKILQTSHASTKSSSNLTFLWAFLVQIKDFLGLIWPLRGPTQKGEGTNMGAGSPRPVDMNFLFFCQLLTWFYSSATIFMPSYHKLLSLVGYACVWDSMTKRSKVCLRRSFYFFHVWPF